MLLSIHVLHILLLSFLPFLSVFTFASESVPSLSVEHLSLSHSSVTCTNDRSRCTERYWLPVDEAVKSDNERVALADAGIPSTAWVLKLSGWSPIWTLCVGDLILVHMSNEAWNNDYSSIYNKEDNQQYQQWLQNNPNTCQFQPVLSVQTRYVAAEDHNQWCVAGDGVSSDQQQRWLLGNETWGSSIMIDELFQQRYDSTMEITVAPSFPTTRDVSQMLFLIEVAVAHNFHVAVPASPFKSIVAHNSGRGIGSGFKNREVTRAESAGAATSWQSFRSGFFRDAGGGGFHEWIPDIVAGSTLDKWNIKVSNANLRCFLNHWTGSTGSFVFKDWLDGRIYAHQGATLPTPQSVHNVPGSPPPPPLGMVQNRGMNPDMAAHLELNDLAGMANTPEEFSKLMDRWSTGRILLKNEQGARYLSRYGVGSGSVLPSFQNCFI